MIEVGSTVRYTGIEEALHQESAGFGLVTDVIAIADGKRLALVQFKKIGRKVKIMVGDTLEEVDVQREGVINEITDKTFDEAVHTALGSFCDEAIGGLDEDEIDLEKLQMIMTSVTLFAIELRKVLFGVEPDGD